MGLPLGLFCFRKEGSLKQKLFVPGGVTGWSFSENNFTLRQNETSVALYRIEPIRVADVAVLPLALCWQEH